VPARVAGACGLLSVLTLNLGWILGGLAQPPAYSAVRDDISDLGARTADSAWLYNQLGANLTGVLVVVLAAGLWRALSPDILGRVGSLTLAVSGLGAFLDGLFRLDCRGIDAHCTNDSWHSHAHKIESGVTAATLLLAPLVLAFAFRRNPRWRGAWLPLSSHRPASSSRARSYRPGATGRRRAPAPSWRSSGSASSRCGCCGPPTRPRPRPRPPSPAPRRRRR
jgi:hypothetical protein